LVTWHTSELNQLTVYFEKHALQSNWNRKPKCCLHCLCGEYTYGHTGTAFILLIGQTSFGKIKQCRYSHNMHET